MSDATFNRDRDDLQNKYKITYINKQVVTIFSNAITITSIFTIWGPNNCVQIT